MREQQEIARREMAEAVLAVERQKAEAVLAAERQKAQALQEKAAAVLAAEREKAAAKSELELAKGHARAYGAKALKLQGKLDMRGVMGESLGGWELWVVFGGVGRKGPDVRGKGVVRAFWVRDRLACTEGGWRGRCGGSWLQRS